MRNSRILVFLLFFLSLFGAFATNAPIYTRLLYLSSLLIGGSWLWVKLSIAKLGLERRSRSLRDNVGDIYDEYFEVANNNPWHCPWVEVQNESNLPSSAGSRLLVGIKRREKRSYIARTWLRQRGSFSLGPTTFISRDPLGLFQNKKSFPAESHLVVLPMVVPISSFPNPPGMLPGGKIVRQKSLGITPHAAGIREYAPSDALRRIHWQTSARRQKLMVKEFDQDPQSSVWIFLDAQSAVQASKEDASQQDDWDNWMLGNKPEFDLPPSTIEYAVTSTASLTHYFIKERRAVGLITSGQRNIVIPADRSSRQEEKILETLAYIQSEGKMPLEELVTVQAGQLMQGSSAILITPSVRPEILHAIDILLRRNLHPTVVLLDAASFGGAKGSVSIKDDLEKLNIPLCHIHCGDDIGQTLSNFSSYKENALWRKPFTP